MKLTDLVYKNFDSCGGTLSKNSWIRFMGESGRCWSLGTITSHGFALTHPTQGRAIYRVSKLKVYDPILRKSILKGPVLTVRIGGVT